MTNEIIRRQTTADRGKGASVTTHEVMTCIKSLEAEVFTTRDVADRLAAEKPGMEYHRLEYAVRAAFFWLVGRDKIREAGSEFRKIPSYENPYRVKTYRLVPESEPADFKALYKAFGMA